MDRIGFVAHFSEYYSRLCEDVKHDSAPFQPHPARFRAFCLFSRIGAVSRLEKAALEKNGDSRLYFSVLDSESPISGSTLFDLHGMKEIDENIQSDAYVSGQAPWSIPEYRHFRSFVHPVFEPLSVRVIYDLKEKKLSYFMNGRGFEYPAEIHGKLFRLQLRHFGIAFVMTYFQNMKEKNKKIKVVHLDRTRYFELSSPQVHVYDDGLELPPPPRFSAYPYGSYALEKTARNDRGVKVSSPLDQTAGSDRVQKGPEA